MYLIKKHRLVNLIKKHEFARFVLVGVLNTLFSYFLYDITMECHVLGALKNLKQERK